MRRAIRRNPSHAAAAQYLGWTRLQLERWTEAVEAYEAAIRAHPAYPSAQTGLAVALQKLKRHEQAVAAYQRAIELDPSELATYYNLGISLAALGRHQEAVFAYRRVIAHDPADAGAAEQLGAMLYAMGAYEEAVEWTRRAFTLSSDPVTARSLGIALYELDRFAEAEEAFREALRLGVTGGERHDVLGRLAMSLAELERYNDAMSLLDELTAAGVEVAYTRSMRSLVLLVEGKVQQALAMAASAIASNSEYPYGYVALGWIQLEAGQGSDALVSFEEGLKRGSEATVYKLGMACSLSSLGRYRESMTLFDEVLETQPRILRRYEPSQRYYDRARRALENASPPDTE